MEQGPRNVNFALTTVRGRLGLQAGFRLPPDPPGQAFPVAGSDRRLVGGTLDGAATIPGFLIPGISSFPRPPHGRLQPLHFLVPIRILGPHFFSMASIWARRPATCCSCFSSAVSKAVCALSTASCLRRAPSAWPPPPWPPRARDADAPVRNLELPSGPPPCPAGQQTSSPC